MFLAPFIKWALQNNKEDDANSTLIDVIIKNCTIFF